VSRDCPLGFKTYLWEAGTSRCCRRFHGCGTLRSFAV